MYNTFFHFFMAIDTLCNQRHPDMLTLKDAGIEISTPATITRASLRQGITFHKHDHGHHHYNHLKYHHDQNDRPHLLMVRSLSPTHTTADSSPQFVQICQKFLLLCGPNFLFHRGVTTKSQISQILWGFGFPREWERQKKGVPSLLPRLWQDISGFEQIITTKIKI